ncbi:VanZ family protein [Marinivivus vitaminiproducens]|uniref:VanZ family protein n=1 Tax=Marinivivus vitaminiproducens TaxID=3035935 RepID=UPI00279CF849|nr:VanZ family protein [Geminicoccaceae bacterium SCSIO 64248]
MADTPSKRTSRLADLAPSRHPWPWGLAAALGLLLVLTFALFALVEPLEPQGEPLTATPAFAADLDGWQKVGDHGRFETDALGGLRMSNDEPGTVVLVRRRLAVPEGATVLRASARVTAEAIVDGPEPWDAARLVLLGLDEHGQGVYDRPHVFASPKGDRSAYEVERDFTMVGRVHDLLLVVELRNATGTITVDDLLIQPMREGAFFGTAHEAIEISWGVWFLFLAFGLMRGVTHWSGRLALLATGATMAVALMLPGEVRTLVVLALEGPLAMSPLAPDDLAHFVMFAGLALVLRLARPNDPLWVQAVGLSATAALTEVVQLFAVERGPSVADWVYDTTGIVLGLLLYETVRRLHATLRPERT